MSEEKQVVPFAPDYKVFAQNRIRDGYDEERQRPHFVYVDNKVEDAANRIKLALLEGKSIMVDAEGGRNVGFMSRVLEFLHVKNEIMQKLGLSMYPKTLDSGRLVFNMNMRITLDPNDLEYMAE